MSYAPTNAAIGITQDIADSLTSAGITNSTASVLSAKAMVDGWLKPASLPQATMLFGDGQTIAAGSPFTTLTASPWTFTPYCARDTLLVANFTGYTTGGGPFGFQVYLDATLIASGNYFLNALNTHTTFPVIQAVIPAAAITYPLVPQTLTIKVGPPGGSNFIVDPNDMITYSVS